MLAWGVAGYLGLQLLLIAVIEECSPHLINPEFAARLALIEQARRVSPKRPLVIMVGSSRCLNAFRPEDLPPIRTRAGAEVLVFNYAHGGSGPVLNQLLVNRLLREGIHPQWLFLEIMPAYLSHDGEDMFLRVMEAHDVPVLRRHVPSLAIYRKYLRNRLLVQQGQAELCRQYMPALFDRDASVQVPQKGQEPDAILEISPLYAVNEAQLKERAVARELPQVQAGSQVYLGARGLAGD